MKRFLLLFSHLAALFFGFMLGIYVLPILTQPDSPSIASVTADANQIVVKGTFDKDRQDSDLFHWGEGDISFTNDSAMFIGELAPGPDYKLYLSPIYVETEADFNTNKANMLQVGDVKTFDRFLLSLPEGTDLSQYTAAIIWCESFGEFITSAKLQAN
ncbi:DM13 domain-containing protein [Vibrio mediterranei]|uniref:DM13 domain-containing protein n=2 Tax=Vibrio mediterranei TaxID=689 RepID=UPI002284F82D|nr:DM13 domain-containing protein [Vibrio mediterranei]MCY9852532.1 DM13 domain-containing protein [Vibrio mediterranei]